VSDDGHWLAPLREVVTAPGQDDSTISYRNTVRTGFRLSVIPVRVQFSRKLPSNHHSAAPATAFGERGEPDEPKKAFGMMKEITPAPRASWIDAHQPPFFVNKEMIFFDSGPVILNKYGDLDGLDFGRSEDVSVISRSEVVVALLYKSGRSLPTQTLFPHEQELSSSCSSLVLSVEILDVAVWR
jgi:hypothetical protein